MAKFALSVVLLGLTSCNLAEGLRHGEAVLTSGERVTVGDFIKGDELMVEKDGARFRVRFLGISALAPVLNDPYLDTYSKLATGFLSALKGKEVQVFFEETVRDATGRYLAYLHANDRDLNLQMVQEGRVGVYTEYGFGREGAYLAAEHGARREKVGVWADPKTVPVFSGLRKQWRAVRRGGKAPADPLLTPVNPVGP